MNKKELEFEFSDSFWINILSNKTGEKSSVRLGEKVGESSVKSSVKIIELIKENNEITIPEIAERTNLTTRAVEKNISKLKQKGLLERVGSAKGGYWEVK